MPVPLIGVTTWRGTSKSGSPQFFLSQTYTSSLVEAGACPVMIPLDLPEAVLEALLSRLDGLLFSGGGDVHPSRYNSQMHPLVGDVDEDRDRIEIYLVKRALESGLPFLGICRGLQVINVAMGGTLYEDILDQHPHALKHAYYPDWPRDYLAHGVQVESASRLASILDGADFQVNSLHHQGIRQLAPSLQATAHAPDGLIEACELPGHPFGLAVQWHPECLQAHLPMRRLFQAFVGACLP